MNFKNILMISTALTLVCSVMTIAIEAKLVLSNGDVLTGELEKLTSAQIHLKHAAFKMESNTALLSIDQVESLTFSGTGKLGSVDK